MEAIRQEKEVEPSILFVGAYVQGTLPFHNDFFDVVVCIGVLHLTNADKTIKEFARVLKPRGLLFMTQAFARNKLLGI